MRKILVTGALGQIGSELVVELRRLNGAANVVASDIRLPPGDAGPRRPVRGPRRHQRPPGPRPRPPPRHRDDLPPGRAAFGHLRREAARGLGAQHGRALQDARGGPPGALRGLLPELDRGLRPLHAAHPDSAGHPAAADHHVRRHQGRGRAAGRLLRGPLRRRRPRPALSGPHLVQRAAGRRHDRLRGDDLLRGAPARPLHLLPRSGDPPRHDVHAGRDPRHGRAHGGRPEPPQAPQRLQPRGAQLHAGRARGGDP